jgi:cytochrome b pre-mRNA-processing protein 3
MFRRLLQRFRSANPADPIYVQIVAQARQPEFYADLGVPDTVAGRFEMIVLHLSVVLRRLRGGDDGRGGLAQGLIDAFFRDMEYSFREMGVSDVAIPRRMKETIRAFYGRAAAYEAALESGDGETLSQAIGRNILGEGGQMANAKRLAHYIGESDAAMAKQPREELLQGTFAWAVAPANAGVTAEV